MSLHIVAALVCRNYCYQTLVPRRCPLTTKYKLLNRFVVGVFLQFISKKWSQSKYISFHKKDTKNKNSSSHSRIFWTVWTSTRHCTNQWELNLRTHLKVTSHDVSILKVWKTYFKERLYHNIQFQSKTLTFARSKKKSHFLCKRFEKCAPLTGTTVTETKQLIKSQFIQIRVEAVVETTMYLYDPDKNDDT